MSTKEGHPTRDELLAMAYVDDELERDARAEFQARLARDPRIARLVVEYQGIELVARQAAPPEPMDHEWRRLAEDGVQRTGLHLGWGLVVACSVGVSGWVTWLVLSSELGLFEKALIAGLLIGFVLLFLCTLRARLRTLPYDPYTKVER